MSAATESGHWQRRALYLLRESEIAHAEGDQQVAKIYADGAAHAKDLAERYRREAEKET